MGTVLAEIATHAEAMALTGDDPWVRWAVPVSPPWRMWRSEQAFIAERLGGRRHSLTLIPLATDADATRAIAGGIEAVLSANLIADLGVNGVSVPQPQAAVAAGLLDLAAGGDWDWMWTTAPPPPVATTTRILELDDAADAAEIEALSRAHSPTAEGEPGTGTSERWVGARAPGGALIGAGAMQRLSSGVPHLAGIVVDPAYRGQGVGSAITAELTRIGLADSQVCTLGMYSDNPAARRSYLRVGYRTAWAWASRRLTSAAVTG